MTADIETIAWSWEVPWHGLGKQVPPDLSTDEMMREAQLDWTVSKRKLYFDDPTASDSIMPVNGNYAIVRDSDNKVFDVCGSAWTPVQNAQAFEFFREFVEAGDAHIEVAGALKGGAWVWVLANLSKTFKLAGNDEVKSYLLCSTPHLQGKAMVFKFTNIRVVCKNTITAALQNTQRVKNGTIAGLYRRAHRGEFDAAAIEMAKVQLGIAREQSEAFAENALKLSKTKVDRTRAAQLIASAFGDEELENATAFELVMKEGSKATQLALHALDRSPGADLKSADGTLWGVLNAITYTTDHLLRRGADSRLYNAWFGKEARIKEAAMASLLDEAA